MNELFRLLLNLLRKGTIMAVDHDAARCRVATGELQTTWLPWLTLAAGETVDWDPPTVGEQILLLCPGGELADGVVVRGLYGDDSAPPSNKPTTHTRRFPDGAVVQYDHDTKQLLLQLPEGATVLLQAPGSVTIKTATALIEADTATIQADSITLDAGQTHCTGQLDVDGGINAGGTIHADGDVTAGSISLKTHTHMEQGDGKKVSAPQ